MTYVVGQPVPESGYRERNSTAERAIDILLLFTDEKLVWTATEIAETLGVARSTSYRYLQSLVSAGLLEEASRGFQLGPRVLDLARLARRGSSLAEIARPHMQHLAAESGESVLLTRRSGAHVVCVDVATPMQPIRTSYEPGHLLPFNAGAAARVLLAWEAPEEVRALMAQSPLQAFTAKTITDPEEFARELERIAESGYALSRGELDAEVLGIAAPIRGADGSVRAAVSVAALSSRVPVSGEQAMTEMVLTAARRISEQVAAYGF
ncbi:MAG: IclR family transcriptional regulator [Leucobacter sp.]